MDTSGYFGKIRQAIIDRINSISDSKIKAAYRTDRSSIDAYPAALVSPTNAEADYNETAPGTNKELYVFTIRLLYPFTEGQENADIALEGALDQLIGVFRDRDALGTIEGAGATWVVPVPSIWGYQDRGAGTYRIAEMKLQVKLYVAP
jgi:hypothetical protein